MKTKITRLLLSAVLMMCCAGVFASTSSRKRIEYETGKFMYFELDDAGFTAMVTWGGGNPLSGTSEYAGSIIIPSTVSYNSHQYNVTSIDERAFESCTGLISVCIPNSMTSIGDYAFYSCSNLSEVFFLGNGDISIKSSIKSDAFTNTSATIYVADTKNFSATWAGRPVTSWRSGKGDGTKASPLEIENYPQLYGFSLEVAYMNGASLCAKLTADITGNANVLNEDGSLKEGGFKSWIPIGSWGSAPNTYNGYSGEFNGNGHTISGLYFNDETKAPVGLFGMADNNGYIHDVGIKDSYFRGKSHVAGICGDLGYGRIENCWNGATVISTIDCVGGIAGSCYIPSSISGCYNIGMVSSVNSDKYGGICGAVAKNTSVTYSVSNCVSLNTKCSRAYNLHDNDAAISNVFIMDASAFESGEVCYILNGNKIDTKWRQQIGKNSYPVLTGNYLVNHSEEKGYYNETMCEHSSNNIHNLTRFESEKCDGSPLVYWHCSECAKDFTDADKTKEKTNHFPMYLRSTLPTETTKGHYAHYYCDKCGKSFKDELCSESWSDDLVYIKAKNNEIWYITTDNQKIEHKVACKEDAYSFGLGKIVLADGVTEIAAHAFNSKNTIQAVSIPSLVNNIGRSSFNMCSELIIVVFHSVPNLGNSAFYGCRKLFDINLNLADSEKPYIGTSLDNYPDQSPLPTFGTIKYYRTLEKGKWGTIVLPFAPTDGLEGLEFYKLKEMTLRQTQGEPGNGGSLVFTKVDAPQDGVPYLVRNVSDSKTEFILTKEDTNIILTPQNQTAGDFTLKGSFQQTSLNTTENKNGNLYYLKDDQFYHANGKINIAPFRAYIEGNGASSAKSFMLIVEEDGEIDAIPGILNGDGNIDETEAIYDLNGRQLTAPVKGQVNIIRTKSGKTIKVNFANRAQ